MSRVILAKSAGFCFGRVALGQDGRGAAQVRALQEPGAPHPQRGRRLRPRPPRAGGNLRPPPRSGPGDRVMIRSHGVSQAVEDALRAAGAEITDATCPNVSRIHRLVAEASANGRQVIVIGTGRSPGGPGHLRPLHRARSGRKRRRTRELARK